MSTFADIATIQDLRAEVERLRAALTNERELNRYFRSHGGAELTLTAALAELAAEHAHRLRLAGLLAEARSHWIDHLPNCHARPDTECSCGRNALLGNIDAALSAAQLDAHVTIGE